MSDQPFQLVSEFEPLGDQPAAIDALVSRIEQGSKYQMLMGVTGSGKTFTMANVIARVNKPTLVISHNKTLAAQLYEEFRELFPNNAVCYFVSYYDYYQPEAYIPQRDIYIEKDASRNDDLDRLRLAATVNLVSRRDVVVVASVSCIFGLGSPAEFTRSIVSLSVGQHLDRRQLLLSLSDLQYKRGDFDLQRATYRVRGDVIEVHPAGEEHAYRIELFGDEVDRLQLIDPVSGKTLAEDKQIFIYPAVHYVVDENQVEKAVESIGEELEVQRMKLRSDGKLLEAQRLTARTKYDLEMIQEVGYCSGIENYSRHLDGRAAGSKPYTLLDYFRDGDWVMMVDESHVTIPQIRAMYNGDQNRKQVLVDHGFRLPSALDNRPLRFEEVESLWPQVVFVSATPGPYELEQTGGEVVEQVIRPTGLVDPVIEIRPASNQVGDLLDQARRRVAGGERTIVTTLTKRLAEDLATYMAEQNLRCRYLHSEIETLERIGILHDLRAGEFDVLIGVNLLREGLDLPEVSLVAILDADKAGFLRSQTSLIQQIGRAARHVNAKVIFYADQVTPAMQLAIDETNRRRQRQLVYNSTHGITPRSIKKAIRRGIELEVRSFQTARNAIGGGDAQIDRDQLISSLGKQMLDAAKGLEFEQAAKLRDKIKKIKEMPEFSCEDPRAQSRAPVVPSTRPRKKRKRTRMTE